MKREFLTDAQVETEISRLLESEDVSKKYYISEKQIKKLKADVTAEAINKTGMLYLAALAERGWSEDDICELLPT